MLKGLKPRLYQETILSTCVTDNCLVVIPTGMGKTAIALMLAIQRLKQYPNSKIVFLAPTKPLAEQHLQTFKKHLDIDEEKLTLFTGFVKPEKRAELWKTSQVIFSTPQGLENDIISERVDMKDVSLMIFDEAHRASGDYAYVFIADQYSKKSAYTKILALTASPGSDAEKINEVCKNLHIKKVEIRTEDDPDVKPYIQETDVSWEKVDLPPTFASARKYLESCFRSKIREIKKYGFINSAQLTRFGKLQLIKLQSSLHAKISQGEKDFEVLKSLSLVAEAVKVQHALELIETQGISALAKYMEKMETGAKTTKVKAVKNLVGDINFRSARIQVNHMMEEGIEHPKFDRLSKIVKAETDKNPSTKIIIFTQYRDSASKIKEYLDKINVKSNVFVGQAKKEGTGLSQKQQIAMLDDFRAGSFNALIATSVAEEGLDIPRVDLVMFYEPIPSAIRHIQRRGRTGRQEKGKVIVLMAKNTRDEGYRWSAFHKERRMHRTLQKLREDFNSSSARKNARLDSFISKENMEEKERKKRLEENGKIKVFADYREKGSGVIKELINLGASMRLEKLETADYLLSSRVGVEYKTKEDFVSSIIDGRLLDQIKNLKRNFERPLIIVEGEQDIYSIRKIHPNAIKGMIATIAVSYGIPLIYTKNAAETSSLLFAIAKREQENGGSKDFSMHGTRKPLTLKEQQEYVVGSFPNVGPGLAKELLKKMGSVKNIINAEEEHLKQVDKLGDKIAKKIKDVVDRVYEDD